MAEFEPSQFRRWLIVKLAETRWGRWSSDRTIEEVANMLGVQTDVLVAAHQYNLAKRKVGELAGLEPIKMRKGGQRAILTRQTTLHVIMPKEIKQEWDTYRDTGGWTDTTLLRSLIHHGLLRREQPKWLGNGWPYRGRTYRCIGWKKNSDTWPWRVITRVSGGAHAALKRRAEASRIAIRGFIRGLILDMLEGRIQSFDSVTEVGQMFQANRYITLEGVLEAKARNREVGKP